jgi:pilus assembly protein TadC
MRILASALTGAAFVGGLVMAWRAFRPAPPRLARVLADLNRRGIPHGEDGVVRDWRERLGESTLAFCDATGLVDTGRLRSRLRILGLTAEEHMFRKVTGAIFGFAAPLVVAGLAALGGVSPSAGWVTAFALTGAAVGLFVPDLGLADRIEAQRQAFTHALSAYLDLVTVILAGGGGLETALHSAADAGDGWAFEEIRRSLRQSRLAGSSPWDGFDRLGSELAVDELRELAASARLAGDHGARIRDSLSAKAD